MQQIICITDEALYELIEQVVQRIQQKQDVTDTWITSNQAMKLLGIKSKTTLQKLRDSMAIKFSQPAKKVILYNARSIEEYLEKHAVKKP